MYGYRPDAWQHVLKLLASLYHRHLILVCKCSSSVRISNATAGLLPGRGVCSGAAKLFLTGRLRQERFPGIEAATQAAHQDFVPPCTALERPPTYQNHKPHGRNAALLQPRHRPPSPPPRDRPSQCGTQRSGRRNVANKPGGNMDDEVEKCSHRTRAYTQRTIMDCHRIHTNCTSNRASSTQ